MSRYTKHKMKENCSVNDDTTALKDTPIFIKWDSYDAPTGLYIAEDSEGNLRIAKSMPHPNPVTDKVTEKRFSENEAEKELREEIRELKKKKGGAEQKEVWEVQKQDSLGKFVEELDTTELIENLENKADRKEIVKIEFLRTETVD